jgi:hypothetical protein
MCRQARGRMLRRLIAFTNSVGKGLYWTVLVLAFGLVQFWIALGDHYAKGNLDWYELLSRQQNI